MPEPMPQHNETVPLAPVEQIFDLVTRVDGYTTLLKHRGAITALFADPELINSRREDGQTVLHVALLNEAPLAMIKFLIDNKADINARTQFGQTPLMFALACEDNEVMVNYLLEQGAEPSLRDDEGLSAVNLAINLWVDDIDDYCQMEKDISFKRYDGLLNLILKTPMQVLENENGKKTLFHEIRDRLRKEGLTDRMDAFPDILTQVENILTALLPVRPRDYLMAAGYGKIIEVRRYLFDHKEDREAIHFADENNDDALMFAVCYGQLEVVKWLVRHSFSLRGFNNDGESALMLAIEAGHESVAKYLVSVMSMDDITAYKNEGQTALSTASAFDAKLFSEIITERLLNTGERSHLMALAKCADVDRLELLLHFNQKSEKLQPSLSQLGTVHERDAEGKTLLHHLVEIDCRRRVRDQFPSKLLHSQAVMFSRSLGTIFTVVLSGIDMLIGRGLDVNSIDLKGNTALMLSAKTPYFPITASLLSNHALVDMSNYNGETALMLATRAGNQETVRVLLNCDANPTLKNQNNKTALSIAKLKNDKVIMQILEEAAHSLALKRTSEDTSSSPKRTRLG